MGMIQAFKPELRIMRYELTDHEWAVIRIMLPNKPRGVPRVDDRPVLNGIFWVSRSGAPWRDLPESFGPYTTCYNRFVRWRRAGVWDQIMDALAAANDTSVQMIDTSIVRVHQHGACIARNRDQSMGRSRGGLTSKIHAVVDTKGLPVRLALTTGEAHDNRLVLTLLSSLKSGAMLLADRGYAQTGTAHAHFFAGRYDDASSWARMALRQLPDLAPAVRIAAASDASAGRLDSAARTMARLRQIDPMRRISNFADVCGPYGPELFAKYVEGVRKAGLPE